MKLTQGEITVLVGRLSQGLTGFSHSVSEEQLDRLNYFAKRLIKIQKGDDTEEKTETAGLIQAALNPWPK